MLLYITNENVKINRKSCGKKIIDMLRVMGDLFYIFLLFYISYNTVYFMTIYNEDVYMCV